MFSIVYWNLMAPNLIAAIMAHLSDSGKLLNSAVKLVSGAYAYLIYM